MESDNPRQVLGLDPFGAYLGRARSQTDTLELARAGMATVSDATRATFRVNSSLPHPLFFRS